ncbi:MAG: TRAP transporter substrate-binding protein [Synergistaceae bacterium]|nr:TRAP transporter substrate-binding protein [Synergistaceae bacterium]
MKKSVFTAIVVCVCVLFAAGAAFAAEFTMKVGHVVPESYPHHIAAVEYLKPYIEEQSDGRIEVELYPNSQLGGDRQLCEAVQIGSLEMAFPSTTILAGFIPELGLLDLPFLFSTRDDVYKVVDIDGPVGSVLAAKAREQGIHLLGYADLGFMNLSNSARPITTPEDAKGIKIRVMENPVYIDTAMALGCSPITMAFGEVYTALQQKVIDGQEHSVNVVKNMKFEEVQDYLSLTREAYSTISIIASEAFMDSLPDDLQDVVRKGVELFCKEQGRINSEQEATNLAYLKEKGMKINELTPEQRELFVEATEEVRKKHAQREGRQELYEQILTLLK